MHEDGYLFAHNFEWAGPSGVLLRRFHLALSKNSDFCSTIRFRRRCQPPNVGRGTAGVTVGEIVTKVHEKESICIPIGSVHRLANSGRISLELIEVQTGNYRSSFKAKRLLQTDRGTTADQAGGRVQPAYLTDQRNRSEAVNPGWSLRAVISLHYRDMQNILCEYSER